MYVSTKKQVPGATILSLDKGDENSANSGENCNSGEFGWISTRNGSGGSVVSSWFELPLVSAL